MSLTWWMRWKSLRLPWRKRILAGADLEGNTYWEIRERASESTKPRRMAQYANSNVHHADVNVSPQWMQWLRHTRQMAPSIEEQEHDIFRQQQLRQLADAADARWAAQPSYLVAPDVQSRNAQVGPAMGANELLNEAARRFGISHEQVTNVKTETVESTARESNKSSQKSPKQQPSPWEAAQKTKDEPDAWKPKAVKR